ncbi:MAG: multidrug transporter ATPase/permease [Acidimicrobiaceae bacterium]|nr:multidrug transporter ATPase/permease [Acidimicrobiaceae bacterium]
MWAVGYQATTLHLAVPPVGDNHPVGRLPRYLRGRASAWLGIASLLPSVGIWMLVASIFAMVLVGIGPVAFILATSWVVGRVETAVRAGGGLAAWPSIRDGLIVAGALLVAQQVLFPLRWLVSSTITWRVDSAVLRRVTEASFAPVGIAALEDPDAAAAGRRTISALRGREHSPGSACAGLVALVARYTQWAVLTVLLAVAFTWWAALAVAASAWVVRTGIRSSVGLMGAVDHAQEAHRRRRRYLRELLLGSHAAKEIRLFGLLDWMVERYRSSAIAAGEPVWEARRRYFFRPFLFYAPVSLALGAVAVIGAARSASEGHLSLSHLAFVLQAVVLIGLLGEFYLEADDQTQFGMQAYTALEKFEKATSISVSSPSGARLPTDLPRREIRFEAVTFAYRHDAAPALRALDLTVQAGQSLAIVGLNGAGKTTLVKLLARLYEPSSGRITVDGIDLRELEPRAWQQQVTAVFQDFVHYDLSLADNVGIGAVRLAGDEQRIRAALERAGGSDLLRRLPAGLSTVLSRQYADGSQLSGGEWQRVAIARALMAVERGARVLVLDEPTANLDVRAEAAFFDQFLDLTQGLTTVLISHRFSTVRRAGRIVVLDQGVVVEDGTHESLLGAGGRYARLFRLQAERFRASASATEETS